MFVVGSFGNMHWGKYLHGPVVGKTGSRRNPIHFKHAWGSSGNVDVRCSINVSQTLKCQLTTSLQCSHPCSTKGPQTPQREWSSGTPNDSC